MQIVFHSRAPIGIVAADGRTVHATPEMTRALRVVQDNVNAVEAGLAALEVINVPSGSISATNVQDAINELDTTQTAHASNTSNPHNVTKTQVGLGNVPDVDATARANHTGTQTAATISDFSTAADARVAAAVGVSVQAFDAELDTWSTKTAPIGTVVGTSDGQTLTGKIYDNPVDTGTRYFEQVAPASYAVASTLMAADLMGGLIQYTGAAAALTLPLGADIEAALPTLPSDRAFDFSVINTGTGTATLNTAAGLTLVGTMGVTAGTSAQFRVRRTASSTFAVYRIS